MHPYQSLLESAIERLGDTTASLGQAHSQLESCRSEYKRLGKLASCSQRYSLTTKHKFEDSKIWLKRVIEAPMLAILDQMERQADLLEGKQERLAVTLDHDIEETKREEELKSKEQNEKAKTLSELRSKKRQFAGLLEKIEAEITSLSTQMKQHKVGDMEETNTVKESIDELKKQLSDVSNQIEAITQDPNVPLSLDEKLKVCGERLQWYKEQSKMEDGIKEWMSNSEMFLEAAKSDLSLCKDWQNGLNFSSLQTEKAKYLDTVKTLLKLLFIPELHAPMVDIMDAYYQAYREDEEIFGKLRNLKYSENIDEFDISLQLLQECGLVNFPL